MSLRVVVLTLALILAAALLAVLAYRYVPVEPAVVDSQDAVGSAASSPEPPRSEADLVPEATGPTDFGITEDEFNEFQNTLLRSLNDEFRTSIDKNVERSWDASTPEADESRREALRQLREEAK